MNAQDVPIFHEANPLKGLQAFAVVAPLVLKDAGVQKQVEHVLTKELAAIGEVHYLKETDMQGFGTGNILLIQMGDVLDWHGKKQPLSRLSLQVETHTLVQQTGLRTFPALWSNNVFFIGDDVVAATELLVHEFAQNYAYVNQGEKDKPRFYVYR